VRGRGAPTRTSPEKGLRFPDLLSSPADLGRSTAGGPAESPLDGQRHLAQQRNVDTLGTDAAVRVRAGVGGGLSVVTRREVAVEEVVAGASVDEVAVLPTGEPAARERLRR
jgi:hypothetical protein